MRYRFLDIGTSNFGTSIEAAYRAGDLGILVEPIKKYLDALPNHPGTTKVNAAVSNYSGKGVMHATVNNIKKPEYIAQDWHAIKDPNLRSETGKGGCNKLNAPHGYASRAGWVQEEIECDVITFYDLCADYQIDSVDFLKVDTEGHDGIILEQVADLIESNKLTINRAITYECKISTELIQKISAAGFSLKAEKENMKFVYVGPS